MNRLLKISMPIVLTLSLMLNVAGCSASKSYHLPGKNEMDIIDKQLDILLDAIEDEDVDAIIDMFSEEALDEIKKKHKMDELEDSIEELISTFPNWDGDHDGYKGLVEGNYEPFTKVSVSETMARGGTILGSARLPEFKDEEVVLKGCQKLKENNVDAVVVIGGDGTYFIILLSRRIFFIW